MKILWIVHADLPSSDGDPRLLQSSQLAGYRLRVAIPASQMPASDQQFLISTTSPGALERAAAIVPDVCVFSKVLPSTPDPAAARHAIALARGLSENRVPFAVDIADNYFEDFRREDTLALLQPCSAAVVNTPAMADIVQDRTNRQAEIIGDPVEGHRQSPRFDSPRHPWHARILRRAPARPVRLLWFGGQWRNYASMRALYPHLALQGKSVEVCVMTSPVPEIIQDVAEHHRLGAPAVTLYFTPWSITGLAAALADCDMVLIPDEVTHPKRIGASTNRLTESIWAGRFVVASGVPSYWEFKDCAWIGADLPAGILWALAHPREVRARIAGGQSLIERHYIPGEIGRKWRVLLQKLV